MKLVSILLSLVSVSAFALRSESTTTDLSSSKGTLYCSGVKSHTSNTRSEGQAQVIRELTTVDSKGMLVIETDGAKVGFKGPAYVNRCKLGGVSESKSLNRQESRQNRSKN